MGLECCSCGIWCIFALGLLVGILRGGLWGFGCFWVRFCWVDMVVYWLIFSVLWVCGPWDSLDCSLWAEGFFCGFCLRGLRFLGGFTSVSSWRVDIIY